MATTYGINTFGVSHLCHQLIYIRSIDELLESLESNTHPIIVGGGSNILFTGDVHRRLLVMDNIGIHIIAENKEEVHVRVLAGTQWHDAVLWSVEKKLGGIENLSLIPGKCGAAPMQNIGAYGVELESVFDHLNAIEIESGARRQFNKDDCEFGYRNSVFKGKLKDKFAITDLVLRLTKESYHHVNTTYGAIASELEKKGITHPTIRDLSDVVIEIRRSKLPDPATLPNAGSFFKNPIVSMSKYEELVSAYGVIPHYPVSQEETKLPAGWLIEQCGWKGRRLGLVGTYHKQALVIVNHGTKDGREILDFSRRIQESVREKFGIILEREVNVY